jgi:hypothetical protein
MTEVADKPGLDRRGFLAMLGASLTVVGLPAAVVAAADGALPHVHISHVPDGSTLPSARYEFGEGVTYPLFRTSPEDRVAMRELAKDMLIGRARAALPPGTRFEVRMAYPTDFGCQQQMGWITTPDMKDWVHINKPPYGLRPLYAPWEVEHESPIHRAEGGYYEVGRYVA